MTTTIGIGVIGMGWMGAAHSRAYRQIPDRFADLAIQPRLVICADEVAERAREAQERFGFEQCTTNWQEVLAARDEQVVNIAAPNHLHRPNALAAAQAGKHIFCEKPVGRNPKETADIAEAARRAGVSTGIGYNYRWAPLVQYAALLIRRGVLGDLTHYRGRFFVGFGSNPHSVLSWRFHKDSAGLGTLGDLMSHAIDMAHFLAGPIHRVVGNRHTFIAERRLAQTGVGTHFTVRTDGPYGAVTNEDYVGALVRLANGAQGTQEACRIIQGPQCQMAFEIHGKRGALAWDFESMNELRLFQAGGDATHAGYTRILSGPEHPFHARFNPAPANGLGYDDLKTIEAGQFLKAVVEKRQGEPGFAEALAVARVQGALERSWETDRWESVENA